MTPTSRRRIPPPATGVTAPAAEEIHHPSPSDLASLGAPFALVSGGHDLDDPVPDSGATDARHTERAPRSLVSGVTGQIGLSAAMRARDATRPTEADLAAAEAGLLIVRRGWIPREDPPPGAGQREPDEQ